MKTLKITVAAVACVCAGGALADTPVNYWNVVAGADIYGTNNLKLDNGSFAAWTNGNILISGSTGYPATIGNADCRNLTISADTVTYGIRYKSGFGGWTGNGRLTVGAGGMDATGSWDRYFSLSCPLHLAADQTWTHPCGVSIGSAVTAEDGITWSLTSDQQYGLGVSGFRFTMPSTLAGVTVVLKSRERLSLCQTGASLYADVLRLEGENVKLHYDVATETVLDRRYAKTLELKDGAIPTFWTICGTYASKWGGSGYSIAQTNVVYDLDAIKVVSGETKLGSGFAYAVKDGAALPVTVESGATLTLTKVPAEGSLKVLGSGILNFSRDQLSKIDISEFAGTLRCGGAGTVPSLAAMFGNADAELTDAVFRIESVAGYTGTLTLKGTTRVALPRTAEWPVGMKVVAKDSAVAYLPQGEEVDASKMTGTCLAVGRGQKKETGTVTLTAGEELVICGDGFGADVPITLAGGTVRAPFDATVASPVHVTATSYAAVSNCATLKASGDWNIDTGCQVFIDNASFTTDGTAKHGRLAFTGTGTAGKNASDLQILCLRGGELTFEEASCEWNLPAGCSVGCGNAGPKYIGILDGATLNFETDPEYNYYRREALALAGNGFDYPVLEINAGSTVTLGEYRGLALGCANWKNQTTLKVNGGTLKMYGSFAIFCKSDDYAFRLDNTTDDRSSRLDILVTDGGVIETDRTFTANPVSHALDGYGFTAGTFMTIDGGTYKIGNGFGIGTGKTPKNTSHSANVLFGAVDDANYYYNVKPEYTCEIKITVGENGATFDLSDAKEGVNAITNTILGKVVANKYFPDGYIPTLGLRWEMSGPLTVKGNGTQEFVMNGFEQGQLGDIVADGVVLKVTGDFDETCASVTLGAVGSGVKIAETNGTSRTLSVTAMKVAAGGSFDARCFDGAGTTVGDLTFEDGATVVAPEVGGAMRMLSSIGTIHLANQMKYYSGRVTRCYGTVLHADEGITPAGGAGVNWNAAEGSALCVIDANDKEVKFNPRGSVLLMR